MSAAPHRFALASGLRVVAHPELGRAAAESLAAALDAAVAARTRDGLERRVEGPYEGWLKGGPLRGESLWRHGLRAALLRQAPPRVREFENLLALDALGLATPTPLLAGCRWRRGLPRRQWLFTRHARGTRRFEELDGPGRARAWIAAAGDLARLHAAGRRHGDAHPRNLLVASDGRVVWIDVWRYPAARARVLRPAACAEDLEHLLCGAEAGVSERARARYDEQRARLAGEAPIRP
ncbi:MAG: lipopolysaccharide kinase InaA family protein [Planctomycetota bacterium]